MAEYLEDDSGIGISTPIGKGGGTFVLNKWILLTWDFPVNAPNPDHFDIVVYTGTDADEENNYVFPIISVSGAERSWIKSTNSPDTTNFRAAVRAVYYKG
tara:strand:- start:612 stop:911 length:300 start_codon:yes stop_codon:yes gene_type:complete